MTKAHPQNHSLPVAGALMEEERVVRIDAMTVSMAREIVDGDVVAQGIGTTLPLTATVLAMVTHAPRAAAYMAIGNVMVHEAAAVTYVYAEEWALSVARAELPGMEMNAWYLPSLGPGHRPRMVEWFRPAEVDRLGRVNNLAVGGNHLPGVAGIPEMSPVYSTGFAYLPRHDRRSTVPKVEFIMGRVGRTDRRSATMITDLGVFDWTREGLQARSLHPGVSAAEVRTSTGFDVDVSERTPTTLMSTEASRALAVVDPLGLRFMEALPSRRRRELLPGWFAAEREFRRAGDWPRYLARGCLGAHTCAPVEAAAIQS